MKKAVGLTIVFMLMMLLVGCNRQDTYTIVGKSGEYTVQEIADMKQATNESMVVRGEGIISYIGDPEPYAYIYGTNIPSYYSVDVHIGEDIAYSFGYSIDYVPEMDFSVGDTVAFRGLVNFMQGERLLVSCEGGYIKEDSGLYLEVIN